MTVQQAEAIIEQMNIGVKVALQHRFAFDSGTMLRLDNYAIINIFDDGRYYIQGANIDELVIEFGLIEEAWDPENWDGEMPTHAPKQVPKSVSLPGLNTKRFDF
jgi:hypothetical protein